MEQLFSLQAGVIFLKVLLISLACNPIDCCSMLLSASALGKREETESTTTAPILPERVNASATSIASSPVFG